MWSSATYAFSFYICFKFMSWRDVGPDFESKTSRHINELIKSALVVIMNINRYCA